VIHPRRRQLPFPFRCEWAWKNSDDPRVRCRWRLAREIAMKFNAVRTRFLAWWQFPRPWRWATGVSTQFDPGELYFTRRRDILLDQSLLKFEIISASLRHLYPSCLQQVAAEIIAIKSVAAFLHYVLQPRDIMSHAQISAHSLKFDMVGRGAKSACPVCAALIRVRRDKPACCKE
jgi:hypothetical protein